MKKIKLFLTLSFMLFKRLFKNPIFVISLISIPVLACALAKSADTDESVLKIGLYAEDRENNHLAKRIIEEFTKQNEKTFTFAEYKSKDKMERAILTDKITCGITFEKDLEAALFEYSNGTYQNEPTNNCPLSITYRDVYEKSANLILCKEAFFSKIYDVYSEAVMLVFAKDKINVNDEGIKKLRELRNEQDVIENFFTFTYANGEKNTILSGEDTISYLLLPLRGLIFSLILLCGMCGGILYLHDEERGFFKNVKYQNRYIYNIAYVFVPTTFASICGFIGLYIGEVADSPLSEIRLMFLFAVMVMAICTIFIHLTRSLNLYVSILPLYIISNIIICPVFINIADFLPIFKYIRLFLPVYYGLMP